MPCVLHASVYPSFYHDMADEMGIMILDESAILVERRRSESGQRSVLEQLPDTR